MQAAVQDLVLFGPGAGGVDVQSLVASTGASGIARRGDAAVRLRAIQSARGADDFARTHRVDVGVVPAAGRLADFGLLAMDMDSTLITIECIDEIADHLGIKPQVAAITESAMRGEIQFPESLRRRVALLAGLPLGALQQVYAERVRLSPGAETLIRAAQHAGIATLLVSGGFTFFTERLRERLGLTEARSNVLEIDGDRLTGRVVGEVFDGAGKAAAVRAAMTARGLDRNQVIVIGDGANDLAMMAEAGVSIAYRAKPVVRAQASYAFDFAGLDGVLALFPEDDAAS